MRTTLDIINLTKRYFLVRLRQLNFVEAWLGVRESLSINLAKVCVLMFFVMEQKYEEFASPSKKSVDKEPSVSMRPRARSPARREPKERCPPPSPHDRRTSRTRPLTTPRAPFAKKTNTFSCRRRVDVTFLK